MSLICLHRKGDLDSNRFMELTELVHKGEKKGIFMDEMPASIHQIIQAENLTFVKNRDVYNTDYFRFIRDLVVCILFGGNGRFVYYLFFLVHVCDLCIT